MDQHSRNNNIEVSGIEVVEGENLKSMIGKIANAINVAYEGHIKVIHRVPTRASQGQSVKIEALQLALTAPFEMNSIDQAASVCAENLLPPPLVRLSHLADALNQARQRLTPDNAQLVIPAENITAYFKLKSATCTFSAAHFIKNFRLPLKKTGDRLAMFSGHMRIFSALTHSTRTAQPPTWFGWRDGSIITLVNPCRSQITPTHVIP